MNRWKVVEIVDTAFHKFSRFIVFAMLALLLIGCGEKNDDLPVLKVEGLRVLRAADSAPRKVIVKSGKRVAVDMALRQVPWRISHGKKIEFEANPCPPHKTVFRVKSGKLKLYWITYMSDPKLEADYPELVHCRRDLRTEQHSVSVSRGHLEDYM